MEPEEKSVIDRCLPLVYQKYLNDPKPENMPTLGDLYDCLQEQKERQAQRIATALEIYVNGSLRVFNHQTHVEMCIRDRFLQCLQGLAGGQAVIAVCFSLQGRQVIQLRGLLLHSLALDTADPVSYTHLRLTLRELI